jgi:hypothetical protein
MDKKLLVILGQLVDKVCQALNISQKIAAALNHFRNLMSVNAALDIFFYIRQG